MEAVQKQQQTKNPLQSNFLQHILQNMKVNMKNIQVNLRDDEIGVQFGFGVESVVISPRQVTRPKSISKQIVVKGIQLYHQDIRAKQRSKLIFIIDPFDVKIGLVLDAAEPALLSHPQFSGTVDVDNFNVRLSSLQGLQMLQVFTKYNSLQVQLQGHAMHSSVSSARDQLVYLIGSTAPKTVKVKDKHEFRSYMKLFCNHYIRMKTIGAGRPREQLMAFSRFQFCSSEPCFCLSQDQNQRLHRLHQILSLQDINLARRMVLTYLIINRCNCDQLVASGFEFDLNETGLKYLMHEQMKWTTILSSKTEFFDNQTRLDLQISLHNTRLQVHNAGDVSFTLLFKEVMFQVNQLFSKSFNAYAELHDIEIQFQQTVLCRSAPGQQVLNLDICAQKENKTMTCNLKLGNFTLQCGRSVLLKVIELMHYDYSNLLTLKHLLMKILAFQELQLPRTQEIISKYRTKLAIKLFIIASNIRFNFYVDNDTITMDLQKALLQLDFQERDTTGYGMLTSLGLQFQQGVASTKCLSIDQVTFSSKGRADVELNFSVQNVLVKRANMLIRLIHNLTSLLTEEQLHVIASIIIKLVKTLQPITTARRDRAQVPKQVINVKRAQLDLDTLEVVLDDSTSLLARDFSYCRSDETNLALRSFELISHGYKYVSVKQIQGTEKALKMSPHSVDIGEIDISYDPVAVTGLFRQVIFGNNRFEQLKDIVRVAMSLVHILPKPNKIQRQGVEITFAKQTKRVKQIHSAGLDFRFLPISSAGSKTPVCTFSLGALRVCFGENKISGAIKRIAIDAPGYLTFSESNLIIEDGALVFKQPVQLAFKNWLKMLKSLFIYIYFNLGDLLDVAFGFDISISFKAPSMGVFPVLADFFAGIRFAQLGLQLEDLCNLSIAGLDVALCTRKDMRVEHLAQDQRADHLRATLKTDAITVDVKDERCCLIESVALECNVAKAGLKFIRTNLGIGSVEIGFSRTLLNLLKLYWDKVVRGSGLMSELLVSQAAFSHYLKARDVVSKDTTFANQLQLPRNALFRDPVAALVAFGNFLNRKRHNLFDLAVAGVSFQIADVLDVKCETTKVVFRRFQQNKEFIVSSRQFRLKVMQGNALELTIPELSVQLAAPSRNIKMENQKIELSIRLGRELLNPEFSKNLASLVQPLARMMNKALHLKMATKILEHFRRDSDPYSIEYIAAIIATVLADPCERHLRQTFQFSFQLKIGLELFDILSAQIEGSSKLAIELTRETALNARKTLDEHLFRIAGTALFDGQIRSHGSHVSSTVGLGWDFSERFDLGHAIIRRAFQLNQPRISMKGHARIDTAFVERAGQLFEELVRIAELSGRQVAAPAPSQEQHTYVQGLYLLPCDSTTELHELSLELDLRLAVLCKVLLGWKACAGLDHHASKNEQKTTARVSCQLQNQFFDGNDPRTLLDDLQVEASLQRDAHQGSVFSLNQSRPATVEISPDFVFACVLILRDVLRVIQGTMDRFRVTRCRQAGVLQVDTQNNSALVNATSSAITVAGIALQPHKAVRIAADTTDLSAVASKSDACKISLPNNREGTYNRFFALGSRDYVFKAFVDASGRQQFAINTGVLISNQTDLQLRVNNATEIAPRCDVQVDPIGAYMQLGLFSQAEPQIINVESVESDWLVLQGVEIYVEVLREERFLSVTIHPSLYIRNLFPSTIKVNAAEVAPGQRIPLMGFCVQSLCYKAYKASGVVVLKNNEADPKPQPGRARTAQLQQILLSTETDQLQCQIEMLGNEARIIPLMIILNTLMGADLAIQPKKLKAMQQNSWAVIKEDEPEAIAYENNAKLRMSLLDRTVDIQLSETEPCAIKRASIGLVYSIKPYASHCKWITIYPYRYIVNQTSQNLTLYLPELNESFSVKAGGRMQVIQLFDSFVVRVLGATTREFAIEAGNPVQSQHLSLDGMQYITIVHKKVSELEFVFITEKFVASYEFVNCTDYTIKFSQNNVQKPATTHTVHAKTSLQFVLDEVQAAPEILLFNTPVDLSRIGTVYLQHGGSQQVLQIIVGLKRTKIVLREKSNELPSSYRVQANIQFSGFEVVARGANDARLCCRIGGVTIAGAGSTLQTISTQMVVKSVAISSAGSEKAILSKQNDSDNMLTLTAKTFGPEPTFEAIELSTAPIQLNCDRELFGFLALYLLRLQRAERGPPLYPTQPVMIPIRKQPAVSKIYFQRLWIKPISAMITVKLSELDMGIFGVRTSVLLRYLQSVDLVDAQLNIHELIQPGQLCQVGELAALLKSHFIKQCVGNAGKILRAVNKSIPEEGISAFKAGLVALERQATQDSDNLSDDQTSAGSGQTGKRQKKYFGMSKRNDRKD